MNTTFDPLRIRRIMGRDEWQRGEEFGPGGWRWVHVDGDCSIIVTQAPLHVGSEAEGRLDLTEWIHASMTRPGQVPSYEDLCRLKVAVWREKGEAYTIHPASDRHVNIHEHALHLWGRADGKPVLPDFAPFGTI